jgi:hypothetical protein
MGLYSDMCVYVMSNFWSFRNSKFCEVPFRSCDKIMIDMVKIDFLDINCRIGLNVLTQRQ